MVQRWLLIVLIAAQVAPAFGGGLCASEATPAAVVDNCCSGCEPPAAADDCCGCELVKPRADQANATLANVGPTIPHVSVLLDALPEPTAVPHAALCFQRTVTPRDFLTCLAHAERAPPV